MYIRKIIISTLLTVALCSYCNASGSDKSNQNRTISKKSVSKSPNTGFSNLIIENVNRNECIALCYVSNFKKNKKDSWFGLREYAFNIVLDEPIKSANIYFIDTTLNKSDVKIEELLKSERIKKKIIAIYKYYTEQKSELLVDPFHFGLYKEPK